MIPFFNKSANLLKKSMIKKKKKKPLRGFVCTVIVKSIPKSILIIAKCTPGLFVAAGLKGSSSHMLHSEWNGLKRKSLFSYCKQYAWGEKALKAKVGSKPLPDPPYA